MLQMYLYCTCCREKPDLKSNRLIMLIVFEITISERSKFIIKKLFELIFLCGGIHYTLLQTPDSIFSLNVFSSPVLYE